MPPLQWMKALSRVKVKKAGDMSRVTPEMILLSGSAFHQALLGVFRRCGEMVRFLRSVEMQWSFLYPRGVISELM